MADLPYSNELEPGLESDDESTDLSEQLRELVACRLDDPAVVNDEARRGEALTRAARIIRRSMEKNGVVFQGTDDEPSAPDTSALGRDGLSA